MRTRTGDLESRQDLAYFVSIHFTSFRCLSLLLTEWPMNAISGWLTSQRPCCMATDRRGWTRHNLLAVRRKEWVKPTERKPYSIKEWEGGVPTKSCYVAEKFTPVCLLDFLFDFSSFSKGQEDVQIICQRLPNSIRVNIKIVRSMPWHNGPTMDAWYPFHSSNWRYAYGHQIIEP